MWWDAIPVLQFSVQQQPCLTYPALSSLAGFRNHDLSVSSQHTWPLSTNAWTGITRHLHRRQIAMARLWGTLKVFCWTADKRSPQHYDNDDWNCKVIFELQELTVSRPRSIPIIHTVSNTHWFFNNAIKECNHWLE